MLKRSIKRLLDFFCLKFQERKEYLDQWGSLYHKMVVEAMSITQVIHPVVIKLLGISSF